jgi:kynurenine formamidase
MDIIDLTMPIDEKTPVFPGDPKPQFQQIATIQDNGWNEKRLTFNSHFGTHIDAPFHMLEDGKKLSDYPIETFVGEAVVISLDDEFPKNLPPIVFFHTGHSKKAYSKDYFRNNPVLTMNIAKELIKQKVRIVGIDSFTPDNTPYDIHKLLFKHDILIVENLVNLDKLVGKRFMCSILPLKIQDADGAPCRVIASPQPIKNM